MIKKPEALELDFYFLGFWTADGSYAKGRLRFLISQLDKIILDFFHAHYGGTRSEYAYNNGISYYSVPASTLAKTMQRANVTTDKRTVSAGKVSFPGKDEFFSFLLGFIDGDGNVSAPSFHSSTRISMIAQNKPLLECLSASVSEFSGVEGHIAVSKGRYYRLSYSRAGVYRLAKALSPYLTSDFRKHRLIADIVDNYDYDRAKLFHNKLDETAYEEMVLLRQQGLSYGEIARRYGVVKQSAMAVVKRRMKQGAVAKG